VTPPLPPTGRMLRYFKIIRESVVVVVMAADVDGDLVLSIDDGRELMVKIEMVDLSTDEWMIDFLITLCTSPWNDCTCHRIGEL